MRRFSVLVFLLMLLPYQPAFGEPADDQDDMARADGATSDQKTSPDLPPKKKPHVADEDEEAPVALPSTRPPDLISFGASYIDFDKDEPKSRGVDFRLEYRWGAALLASHGDWMDFGIHPMVGGLVSTRSQVYVFGGFAFDWVFWKHVVLTESEVVGLFNSGNARPLGSFIEFRSQIEGGWRFDNDVRITAQASHISNANIGRRNPGEEMAGAYVHIPVADIFGH